MPADAELRITAAVQQAVEALRQVRSGVAGVATETTAGGRATRAAAAETLAATKATQAHAGALSHAGGEMKGLTGHFKTGTGELAKLTRGTVAGSGAFTGLGRSMAFASGAFLGAAGLVDAIKKSVDAADTFNVAQRQMQAQLQANGENVKAVTPWVDKLAESNAKLGFTSAQTEDAFTRLDRASGSAALAYKYMGVAADLAAAKHIDLSQAALLVGKVVDGATSALNRYGIAVPKGTSATEALQIAQQKLAGQAAAAVTPFQQFHATINNLEVAIGERLLPMIEKYVSAITGWIGNSQNQKKITDAVQVAVTDLGKALDAAWRVFKAIEPTLISIAKDGFAGVKVAIDLVRGAFDFLASVFGKHKAEIIVGVAAIGLAITAAIGPEAAAIVGVVVAVGYIKTHWSQISAFFVKLWDGIKQTFAEAWTWIQKTAYDAVLKIIEPFSHLPKWLGGGWAQDMKKNLQGALDGLQTTAQQAGTAVGVSFATSLQGAIEGAKFQLPAALGGSGGVGVGQFGTTPTVGGTGQGTAAANAALSMVGKVQYSWGGGHGATPGPSRGIAQGANTIGLDCSGFARAVLAQAGIVLPAESADQLLRGAFFHPAVSELKPGDLVFYEGSHPNHVAVYIGDGKVVHAPHTGESVQIASVNMMKITGTARYWGGKDTAAPAPKADKPVVPSVATLPDTTAIGGPPGSLALPDMAAVKKPKKAKAPPTLSESGVAGLRQQISDMQQAALAIFPASLRNQVEQKATALLDAIHKGLGVTATDKIRSDLAKLKTQIADDLRLDKGVQAAKDSVATISAQISGWPDTVRKPLQGRINALSVELGDVLKPADLARAKAKLKQLQDSVKATIAAAKTAVTTANTEFSKQWQGFAQAADKAFDSATQAAIKAQRITVLVAGGGSFEYAQGDVTPAEQQLKALQDQAAQAQRDQAKSDAADALAAATSKYQAMLAVGVGGTDTTGNVISQADIDQAARDVRDAQRTVDQAALDQRESDLQKQADLERGSADAQFQTWQDAYTARRDVEKAVLDDQLANLQTALANQTVTWQGAMDDITRILGLGGSDSATAFWTAFNAATAAAQAAGGSDPAQAAQQALSALGSAQATVRAETAAPALSAAVAAAGSVVTSGGSTYYRSLTGTYGHKLLLAGGGVVTKPTLAMVGEKPGMRGGEGVIPLDDPRALALIGQAIADALPGGYGGGVTAVFPNAIIPGRDRDAARRLARMAGPELSRVIGYRTSP